MATTDKEIKQLILNVLTEEQYASATKNDDELYLTPISESDSTDSKPISLFGNHSILVPKDSGDTAIDLYSHSIYMTNNDDEELCFTYYSSSNLKVDSFTDLNTLLGTTSRSIGCNGILKDGNNVYSIFILSWKGKYATSNFSYSKLDEDGLTEFTSLSRFTIISDVVTTI